MDIFEWLVLLISLCLLVRSIKRVSESAGYIVHLIFWVIFVLPLFLDLIGGYPNYFATSLMGRYKGFILSYQDVATRIIYALFLVFAQWIILSWGVRGKRSQADSSSDVYEQLAKKSVIRNLIILSMFLVPILTIVFQIDYHILFTWGWRDFDLSAAANSKFYSGIERLTYIGASASILYLFRARGRVYGKILALLALYANVCAQGKRGLLFFCLLMIVILTAETAKTKRKKVLLIIICIIATTVLLFISLYIKQYSRGYSANSFEQMYVSLRIDLFRDDVTKMAIYSLLNADRIRILSYPGQSILSQIPYLFPLCYIKFISKTRYATYLSCALLGVSLNSSIFFMTTSIIDEMIANFGIIGFVVGPLVLAQFARSADRHSIFLKPLIIGGAVLSMMFAFSFTAWYFEFLVIASMIDNRNIKRMNMRCGRNPSSSSLKVR